GADRSAASAIDDFEEVECIPQSAGPDVVIVFFVLNAKGDPRHLLLLALDDLELSAHQEIPQSFFLPDQQRKMFVGPVAGQLRQHWTFVGGGWFGRNGWQQARRVIQNYFPLARFAF